MKLIQRYRMRKEIRAHLDFIFAPLRPRLSKAILRLSEGFRWRASLNRMANIEPDARKLAASISAAVPGVEALTRQQAIDGSPGVSSVRSSFAVILALFYAIVPLVTGLFFVIITFQKASALSLLALLGVKIQA